MLTSGTIGTVPALFAPPYQFSIPIPRGVPSGHYLIGVMGTPKSGSDPVFGTSVDVDVERPDNPRQLKSDGNSVNFDAVGSELPPGVTGAFADGSRVRLTASSLIGYSSDSPGIATVDWRGVVTAVGPGKATITITYGNRLTGSTSIQVPAYVPDPVTVDPSTTTLNASQTEKFAATLALDPALDQTVIWSISPALGSIDQTGLYTAPPSVASRQSVTVTATSVADPAKSASAQVWIVPLRQK